MPAASVWSIRHGEAVARVARPSARSTRTAGPGPVALPPGERPRAGSGPARPVAGALRRAGAPASAGRGGRAGSRRPGSTIGAQRVPDLGTVPPGDDPVRDPGVAGHEVEQDGITHEDVVQGRLEPAQRAGGPPAGPSRRGRATAPGCPAASGARSAGSARRRPRAAQRTAARRAAVARPADRRQAAQVAPGRLDAAPSSTISAPTRCPRGRPEAGHRAGSRSGRCTPGGSSPRGPTTQQSGSAGTPRRRRPGGPPRGDRRSGPPAGRLRCTGRAPRRLRRPRAGGRPATWRPAGRRGGRRGRRGRPAPRARRGRRRARSPPRRSPVGGSRAGTGSGRAARGAHGADGRRHAGSQRPGAGRRGGRRALWISPGSRDLWTPSRGVPWSRGHVRPPTRRGDRSRAQSPAGLRWPSARRVRGVGLDAAAARRGTPTSPARAPGSTVPRRHRTTPRARAQHVVDDADEQRRRDRLRRSAASCRASRSTCSRSRRRGDPRDVRRAGRRRGRAGGLPQPPHAAVHGRGARPVPHAR